MTYGIVPQSDPERPAQNPRPATLPAREPSPYRYMPYDPAQSPGAPAQLAGAPAQPAGAPVRPGAPAQPAPDARSQYRQPVARPHQPAPPGTAGPVPPGAAQEAGAPATAPAADSRGLPPARPLTVWLTWLWRLALLAACGYALWLMFVPLDSLEAQLDQALYFTTLTTMVTALALFMGVMRPLVLWGVPPRRKLEPRRGWLRGLATSMCVFTGLIFGVLMGGGYDYAVSFIPHLLLPVAMVVDWVGFGRNQGRMPWYAPLAWSAVLLPYIWAYMRDAEADEPMYGFLDPADPSWWTWIAGMVGGFLVVALVIWGLGRLRGIGQRS